MRQSLTGAQYFSLVMIMICLVGGGVMVGTALIMQGYVVWAIAYQALSTLAAGVIMYFLGRSVG